MSEKETDLDLFGNATPNMSEEKEHFEYLLTRHQHDLDQLPADAPALDIARKQLDIAEALLGLNRNDEAWSKAREAFDTCLANEAWQDAVEACNLLYQTEQPASIPALGMGIWLAVTYPVDPEISYTMLEHLVDETPANADGAALAAVAAKYLIDLRADEEKHDSIAFLGTNLITRVAARHSQVKDQAALDLWMDRLELRKPEVFLPRLGLVIGAIVGEQWWFDRDELREKLPQ